MSLPPPPIRENNQNSLVWQTWYRKISEFLSSNSFPWTFIDKSGSSLSDIENRPHSALQSVLGSRSHHLSSTQHASLIGGGDTTLHYHLADRSNTSFTQYEADLGTKPVSNGSFTISGSGLTTGKPVLIAQAAAAYTGKGTYADEIEMDQIVISGYVQDATTIKCHWGCSTRVRGNVKFNYLVSA